MTYEDIEQDVLSYLENCSAGNIVDLYNFIYDCEAEVEWDGNDNPQVTHPTMGFGLKQDEEDDGCIQASLS